MQKKNKKRSKGQAEKKETVRSCRKTNRSKGHAEKTRKGQKVMQKKETVWSIGHAEKKEKVMPKKQCSRQGDEEIEVTKQNKVTEDVSLRKTRLHRRSGY